MTGLLGPLLLDPGVEFTKATYRRPDPIHGPAEAGGGRVTELMARPLIAAFWPELSTVLQPLSGEYAARRSLLERLRFRCGYGVDIALLVDTWRTVGLGAIAQVDLHERHHRHSDLSALGRMAAEVLHTVFDRLAADGTFPRELAISTTLLQPLRLEGALGVMRHDIDTAERPPLQATMPKPSQPPPQTFGEVAIRLGGRYETEKMTPSKLVKPTDVAWSWSAMTSTVPFDWISSTPVSPAVCASATSMTLVGCSAAGRVNATESSVPPEIAP